jgi:hypothetical protein
MIGTYQVTRYDEISSDIYGLYSNSVSGNCPGNKEAPHSYLPWIDFVQDLSQSIPLI